MDGDDTIAARKAMIEEIAVEVAGTRNWLGKDSLDHRVMAVMEKVARHLFISEADRKSAYANRPASDMVSIRFLVSCPISCRRAFLDERFASRVPAPHMC